METEFIYYRHTTPVGIKIEEISGYEQKSGKIWCELARQVYCENGKNGYRFINHYPSGVPFLEGESSRISISHTNHMFVVASLPSTPEANLEEFNVRTALGVDVERKSRGQVLKIRDKFLSDVELNSIDSEDVEKNIIAWTSKEALYKASLIEGIEFKSRIIITQLPDLHSDGKGKAYIIDNEKNKIDFLLYSYISDDEYIITIAYSQKSSTFKKHR